MKLFLLVGFLLVGLVYSTPVETSIPYVVSKDHLLTRAIESYLNKKVACKSDSTTNATEIFREMGDCLDPYSPSSAEDLATLGKPGSSYDICENPEKKEKIAECFLPVIDLLKGCGDDDEKYLPEFIIDAIRNLINFACVDEGKNIPKIMQDSTTRCFKSMQDGPGKTAVDVCGDEADSALAMLDDGVMTKKELCGVLEAEKVCYVNYAEKQCSEDSSIKEVIGDFVDAIAGPCSK